MNEFAGRLAFDGLKITILSVVNSDSGNSSQEECAAVVKNTSSTSLEATDCLDLLNFICKASKLKYVRDSNEVLTMSL